MKNIREKIAILWLNFLVYYEAVVKKFRILRRLNAFRSDMSASGNAVGGIIGLFIGILLCSVVGLYMTPTFVVACTSASWAFNNSTWETIMDIIFTMVLPVLWVLLFVSLLTGVGIGVYRLATKL